MLQIQHLSIFHNKDLTDLIRDFSFVLNPGDKAVIIGEEGNGKSTLLKLLVDPLLVDDYVEYAGDIRLRGEVIGYLPQELPEADREKTLYAFFSEVPDFLDESPRELAEMAGSFGLATDFFYADQTLGTLSGGEKIKAQLARVLLQKPTVLLLDEPSNDLDIDTLRWLERYLAACPLPLLFVSHDETLIERVANVVIHLEKVRKKTVPRHTVARMPYRQYIDERLSKFARQEQLARKEQDEFDQRMEKYRQIEQKVEHQQNAISRQNPSGGRLLKKKMHAVKSMGRRFEREAEDMTQMPDVEEAILLRFQGTVPVPRGKTVIDLDLPELAVDGRVLARNLRLHVSGGEKLCLIGRNGIGKTTLLRRIADELLARTDIRAGYMPQNYEDLLAREKTAVDFLAVTGFKEETTKIRTWLGSMKFTTEEMERPIAELSGGQKAKLFFLKMNLDGANVLLLDEPTRNFSPLSNPVIREVLGVFTGTILSISHDRAFLRDVCDRVMELTPEGLVPVDRERLA